MGKRLASYDTFPLLLKFIDAREPLSVQVHPDDKLARSLAGVPRGKTEAWVVLRAEPGRQMATPDEFVARWAASADAVAFFEPRMWEFYQGRGLSGRVIAADSYTIAVSRL